VIRALRDHGGFEQQVIMTGQHRGLAAGFDSLPCSNVTELPVNPAEQSAGELRDAIHDSLCRHLRREEADLVLVQGDTSSAYAGALAARDRGIALAHVEAGLRSFDLQQPWPEEGYRIAIDHLSDLLFAPTEAAVRNLKSEPRVRGAVHLTGNSGIDALFDVLRTLPPAAPPESRRKRILVTCHRRENRGDPLRRVAEACRRLVRELPVEIVLPLHGSPVARRSVLRLLGREPHVHLIDPLDYRGMVELMTSSWLILTDSGGIQEEAPALGRPVLVLREVTEREEAVSSANAELVGTDADRIVNAVSRLIADESRYATMSRPNLPFGDGRASERIVTAISAFFARPPSERQLAAPVPLPCFA
jgi:UDP-N-acetylglucosamine 2-epimerase (non-hydrolysing)